MSSRGRNGVKTTEGTGSDESSAGGVKRKGSGGWIFALIIICGVMYLSTMLIGQSRPSAVISQSEIPLELKGQASVSSAVVNPVLTPANPQPSQVISSPIQKKVVPEESITSKAFNAASMSIQRYKEKEKATQEELSPAPIKQVSVDISSQEWVAPPSQANFGETNPRHITRPNLRPQSENFIRARKAVWETGRPVLTAPMPDEYIPHLTAPKRPMKTRKPFSLPTPMWNVPHVPTNDAILALAVNYRIIDYVRFVGTLRRTGYSGDIVLAVSAKMDDNSMKFLKSMDVIAYPVAFNCSKGQSVKHSLECDWNADQDVALPLAIIRHELYLSWAWLYEKSSRLLILDFRDTFFQRDPFESLTLGTPAEPYFQQLLILEHWPYKRMSNCPWNSGWVRGCFGKEAFKPMSNHPILCSGSYFATRDGMIDIEAELLNEVRSAKCHKKGVPSDQGYVNYLFWAKRLPYAIGEVRGDGIVNTVGALMGKNHGGSIGPLSTWFKIISPEGFVMDNDNKTHSAVVHQWDRFFDELYWTVDAVLECDDCYTSKNGYGTYTCKCLKQGCQCKEGKQK